MGKGSTARPLGVDRKKFEDEFDRIFKHNKNETLDTNKRKSTESSKKIK